MRSVARALAGQPQQRLAGGVRRFGGGAHKEGEHHEEHHGDGHGDAHGHAAEGPAFPKGRLFGEPARRPGEKRVREDWELIWYWGFGGAFVLAAVGLATKPDTTPSAWARRELLERQEQADKKN
jgi:hypothetical protein